MLFLLAIFKVAKLQNIFFIPALHGKKNNNKAFL